MIKTIVFSCLILMTAINAKAQVTLGLVARYSFDKGTAEDEIGINHGTVNGAVLTNDRFGNPGRAYKFTNGENITLPNSPVLKSPVMTVAVWVKIDGYNPGTPINQNFVYSVIKSKTSDYYGAFAMSLYNTDGKYFGISQNNPSEHSTLLSTSANTGGWQHYVMSIDNDSLKMYIDNVYQGGQHKGFANTFNSDSVYIGVSGHAIFYGNLKGRIDDIRVYNRVLTATDIDTLYKEADPKLSVEPVAAKPKIRLYPNPAQSFLYLDQVFDVTITDISGKILLQQDQTTGINIAQLFPGLYFVLLKDRNGEIVQRDKLIKE